MKDRSWLNAECFHTIANCGHKRNTLNKVSLRIILMSEFSEGTNVPNRVSLRLLNSPAILAWLLVSLAVSAVAQSRTQAHKQGRDVAEAQAFIKSAETQLKIWASRLTAPHGCRKTLLPMTLRFWLLRPRRRRRPSRPGLLWLPRRFDHLKMPPDLARKFKLLKLSLIAPAPNNDKERSELTRIAASLDADYGKGKYCKTQADGKEKCLSLND